MQLHHHHREPASASTLSFATAGGPIVAVAGVCGGAGASTFAHLIAAAAARQSAAPVLLAETGGPTSSIAPLVGAASRQSLIELARDLEGGRHGDELFALAGDGLRVIASRPRFERDEVGDDAVDVVVADARNAHGLTVIDCTSLTRSADLLVIERATHVIWVAPSSPAGWRQAAAFVDSLDLAVRGRELFAIRYDGGNSVAPAEWAALAELRDADVVLVPEIEDVEGLPVSERIDRAAIALDAVAGALR